MMTRMTIAAALLLAAGPALAQTSNTPQAQQEPQTAAPAQPDGGTGPLSEDNLRTFFNGIGERAERAVEDGNWKGISAWLEEHVADDAGIAFKGSVVTHGPVMSYDVAMRGADLHRMAAMTMGPMAAHNGAITDYTARSQVRGVTLLPNGGASAVVLFYENGVLDFSAMTREGDEADGDNGSEASGTRGAPEAAGDVPENAVFESVANCMFRVSADGDTPVIDLAACETATTL